ncbi:MAG: RNA polymerase sigma factor [Mangrovibacterium sp.]
MGKSTFIIRLKAGEKNALNELYAMYSKRLYGFAFGYFKSEEDSRDIVQEVFIKLWNSREELKEDSHLEAFLFTVAKNTIISSFRKKISEKEYLEQLRFLVVKNNSDTEKQVDYKLLEEKVQELIHSLPEQRQRVYLLSKEEGYSNKSIAEELHISVKTVEDHITKARKFLKKHLKEYGFLSMFL